MKPDAIAAFAETSQVLRSRMLDEADHLIAWYQHRIEELRAFVPALTALTRPLAFSAAMPSASDYQVEIARRDIVELSASIDLARTAMIASAERAAERFAERIVELRVYAANLRRATDPYLGLPCPAARLTPEEESEIRRIAGKFAPPVAGDRAA